MREVCDRKGNNNSAVGAGIYLGMSIEWRLAFHLIYLCILASLYTSDKTSKETFDYLQNASG
jgi:hypothetical protein